jgi:hypothetical protein
LGCLQGRKRHTFGGARTHSNKLLEARIGKRYGIMNLIVLHRKQSSMLDLQVVDHVINKENLPLVIDPQNKKLAPQLN